MLLVHSSSNLQKCEHCNKTFSKVKTLKIHLKNVHDYENHEFKCDFCQKIFKSSESLKGHILRVHENRKLLKMYHMPKRTILNSESR